MTKTTTVHHVAEAELSMLIATTTAHRGLEGVVDHLKGGGSAPTIRGSFSYGGYRSRLSGAELELARKNDLIRRGLTERGLAVYPDVCDEEKATWRPIAIGDIVRVGPAFTSGGYEHDEFTGVICGVVDLRPDGDCELMRLEPRAEISEEARAGFYAASDNRALAGAGDFYVHLGRLTHWMA